MLVYLYAAHTARFMEALGERVICLKHAELLQQHGFLTTLIDFMKAASIKGALCRLKRAFVYVQQITKTLRKSSWETAWSV